MKRNGCLRKTENCNSHSLTFVLKSRNVWHGCTFCPPSLAPPVLFRMRGIAHAYEPLSLGFDVEKIKQELRDLGDDLNCDIDLTDL